MNITASTIEGSHFENSVALYETRHDIDLIAMVHYPNHGNTLSQPESLSKKVTHHSSIPVLIMPIASPNH
ncbi:MAG: hypothetical protein EOP48_31545 [Sphingobacteriales bacterium]|nr:MAG: hypothetical protein EOP48_31545 [Sphingobacteriales bacterium]